MADIKTMYVDNTLYYGKKPKGRKRKCKYCGIVYKEFNVYDGFCSWTCKARYLRALAEKENEKYGKSKSTETK